MTECDNCKWFDNEDNMCTAFVCDIFDCDSKLPCEKGEIRDEEDYRDFTGYLNGDTSTSKN